MAVEMTSYEWQFEGDHGWVTYSQSERGNDYCTTTTSNDIEKHFCNDSYSMPMLIESKKCQYVLDFQDRVQTNQQTSAKRRIRRVRSLQHNTKKDESEKVGGNAWFFLDEHNRWIKYGETGNTNVQSQDIEQHFTQNSTYKMDISGPKFKYVIDFENMTQTNTSTHKVRPIRRLFTYSLDISDDDSSARSDTSPSNWAPMNGDYVSLIRLNTSHPEYIKQVKLIKGSLPGPVINNIYRIQHEYLWTAYKNRRNFWKKRFPGQVYEEKYLFHGTNKNNLENIYKDNFDCRLYGTNVGNIYGKGTYFSNSAGYSADYCSGGPPKVMFIVRVLVGRIAKGDSQMVKPPNDSSGQPCDTTVDDVNAPTIFVKYDSAEYYPEYYFEFGGSEQAKPLGDGICHIM